MTIETTVNKTIQSGNGSNKDFDFAFEIPDEDSLSLTKRGSDGTETAITTNYTVTGIGDEAGGTVNYPTSGSALAANEKIIIKRVVALKQPENLRNQGDYSLEDIEDALDRAVMMCQQLQEQIDRCLKLNLTSSSTYVNVDDFVANRLLVVSSDGQSIEMSSAEYGSIDAYLSTLTAIAADISTVAGIAADVTTVAGIDTDVTTVAGIADAVTSVAAISANVSTVAGISANVTTVAGMSSNIASVVANMASILNAASFGFPTLVSGDVGKALRVNSGYNGYDVISITPTIQKFTSGSGTYTTPANTKYIRVRMVGAGGGGAGGGTSNSAGAGGNGGNTTFGTTLLVANGGSGAGVPTSAGGDGGSASLGTGPIGTALSGSAGSGNGDMPSANYYVPGGAGGCSPFGGAGGGGTANQTGYAAKTNSGSGGGGGGSGSSVGARSGPGGGAGGFVDAIIGSPSATYSYAVGAAGAAGTAGTSGYTGGAGGSGYIEVTEYY